MDPGSLRCFLAVARERNFSRAAERLHIAQPPLSQRIQRLERELGVALFDRAVRPIALTNAGERLLDEAPDLLARHERVRTDVARAARGEAGRLRLACAPSVLYGAAPRILREYQVRFPGVAVSVHEMDTTPIIEQLLAGDIDAGLLRTDPGLPELAALPLYDEPLVAALPDDHPRAAAAAVALADLGGDPFVMFRRDRAPENFDAILAACTNAGFSPHVAIEPGGFHAQVGYVASGLGIAIVPESISHIRLPGVRYLPLTDPTPPIPTTLVHPTAPNPLVAHLRETAERTL